MKSETTQKAEQSLRTIIDVWKAENKEEWDRFEAIQSARIAGLYNDYGASKGKSGFYGYHRHLLEIPNELARTIHHYYPSLFYDKTQTDWFLKTFPIFRVGK